jgi:nicotinate-nucleotide adenylyltransferase
MRLGIFGGSFDPVHFGHLLLAECCREQCRLDAVWFLPTAVPPHKQDRELTPAARRIELIELAIAGNPAFSVCSYETDRGGVNYTVDTLAHLREKDPSRELFFLLGADMLLDLPRWRNAAQVCELALPVVVHRPGSGQIDFQCLQEIASTEQIELIRQHQVEMPEIGISSTELRRRVQSGLSIRYRVPRAVEMYIETHGLYRRLTPAEIEEIEDREDIEAARQALAESDERIPYDQIRRELGL